MALPIIPLAAALILLTYIIYKHVIYPLFLSPLSRIPPAHWSSPVTSLWILYHRHSQNDTLAVHAAHTRLGPIIRLAPNEISLNSVNGGIRTIYAGGFEKGTWYSEGFANFGLPPMFGMHGSKEHGRRKRMVSHVYAKSTLQGSEALARTTDVLVRERLQGRLREMANEGREVEMYELFAAAMMDFVTAYVFGLKQGSDFLRQEKKARDYLLQFKARQSSTFWSQEMLGLLQWMEWLGLRRVLVPKWVDQSNADSEAWVMSMCDQAEEAIRKREAKGWKGSVEDTPTVYAQLREGFLKEARKQGTKDKELITSVLPADRLEIASELTDHVLAGFDTSSITLTWLAWQLSHPKNSHWQERLRSEISTLNDSLDPKLIDALPILHAVLMETLRLHAAIPGNQPRLTPSGYTSFGDSETGLVVDKIPAGVRVQSQAYSLHRNPSVFPDPDEWKPDRWLLSSSACPAEHEAKQREQLRWFWAFSSGGRMCVGSNLAMLDMKATIVGVWGMFAKEIVDERGMMRANGGYLAEPLGVADEEDASRRKFLRVKLKKL